MKLRNFFIIVVFLFFNTFLFAQNSPDSTKYGNLTVVIKGFKSNKGNVKIGLYNSEESYSGKQGRFEGAIAKIENQKVKWVFENIPFGIYAIKVYHDEDEDNEIDKNFLGIPTESYGFSNNAKGAFGPPSFEDAKFKFNNKEMKIEIQLN